MEVYQAYADVSDKLGLTEEMICQASVKATGGLVIPYGDETIDLATRPWRRAPMNDLVAEATGVDIMVGLYELNPVVTHSLKPPGFNP